MVLSGTCQDMEGRKGVDRVDRDGMIHPRLRALDSYPCLSREKAEERDGLFHGALWNDSSFGPNKRAKTERASCRRSWERRKGVDRSIAAAGEGME